MKEVQRAGAERAIDRPFADAGVQELRSGDDPVLIGGKYANCVRLPAVSAGYRTQFGHGDDRRAVGVTEQHLSVTNECHD